jgi:hypothetical protein
MQIWDGACCPLAAGNYLSLSQKPGCARKLQPARTGAHPVSNSRDQQPPAGSSPRLNQSIHAKSTVLPVPRRSH